LQWSETLEEAKAIIEDWRREYTESGLIPLSTTCDQTEFVRPAAFQALYRFKGKLKTSFRDRPGNQASKEVRLPAGEMPQRWTEARR
jgi:hypothetical protein